MKPSNDPLHLLRALLRQCTYLPDPAAREYLHRHILSRYRAYCPRPPARSAKLDIGNERGRKEKLLQTARDGLAILLRANSGYKRALVKVLALTYGRTGKRRYELLSPLLVPDTPSNQTAVASLSASLATTTTLNVPPKLQALLKSQAQQNRAGFDMKLPIKQTQPVIPKKDIWRRPVAIKRVRNIEKRWLRMILERAMPPLPEEEWERLRRLATGELRWEGPVQRRATVEEVTEEVESLFPRGSSVLEELDEQMTFLQSKGHKDSSHRINQRFMRRLWAHIFTQCPLMRYDARKKTWVFEWGALGTDSGTDEAAAVNSQWDAFEGVGEDGKLRRQFQGVDLEGLKTSKMGARL